MWKRSVLRLVASILLLTGIAAFSTGCSALYRAPEVHLVDVQITGLGLTSGIARVYLEVDNPNPVSLEVQRVEYLLELRGRDGEWNVLSDGISSESLTMVRRGTTEVPLEVVFQYRALGAGLLGWWESGEVTYRIQGDLSARGPLGPVNLPFRASGRF
ncbi:MAG: hypothetical protein EA422_06990 [Gemmatimonadales bacterium]|nr:MAG: hypothetical protein EA422_06990 [Gemmatimonadales bacterium]